MHRPSVCQVFTLWKRDPSEWMDVNGSSWNCMNLWCQVVASSTAAGSVEKRVMPPLPLPACQRYQRCQSLTAPRAKRSKYLIGEATEVSPQKVVLGKSSRPPLKGTWQKSCRKPWPAANRPWQWRWGRHRKLDIPWYPKSSVWVPKDLTRQLEALAALATMLSWVLLRCLLWGSEQNRGYCRICFMLYNII